MTLQRFKYKIKWSNFTHLKNPPPGEEHDAYTVARAVTTRQIKVYQKSEDEKFRVKPKSVVIEVRMFKKESWAVKGKMTDELLAHEQLHYNIAALGGRDMERKLLALEGDTIEEMLAGKEQIEQDLQTLMDKVSEDYDSDILWGTDHGRKATNQDMWKIWITKLMGDPTAELKSLFPDVSR